MDKLTDDWFANNGFDTSSEPFTRNRMKVYKNYIRDGSGRYDGYLIEFPCVREINSVQDFLTVIMER